MPFLEVVSPAKDPFTNAWIISVYTNDIFKVGDYKATLVVQLTDYPLVAASKIDYTIYIASPCDITEILPVPIMPMEFTISFVQPNLQIFTQW